MRSERERERMIEKEFFFKKIQFWPTVVFLLIIVI